MAEFAMATPSAPPRPSKDDVVDAGREREVDVVLDVLGRHLEADGDAAGLFTHLVGGGAEVVCGHQVREPGRADRGGALLYAGANVNARLRHTLWFTTYNRDLLGVDRAGATPFWCAAHATDVPAMKLLLEYGADPDLPTIKVSQRGGGRADRPDPSGLPPVPMGGPAVNPIHAAAGVGYGQGYAGNSHRHAPEGWMPTMRFLVEELGAGVNARDINGYTPGAPRRRARRQRDDPVPGGEGRRRDGGGAQRADHGGHGQRARAADSAVPGYGGVAGEVGGEEQSSVCELLRGFSE